MKDSSLNSIYRGDCNWSIKNLRVCASVTSKVLLLKRSHELMPPEMEGAWPCLGLGARSQGNMLHVGNHRWGLCYDQKTCLQKRPFFRRPDIFMWLFLNKVGESDAFSLLWFSWHLWWSTENFMDFSNDNILCFLCQDFKVLRMWMPLLDENEERVGHKSKGGLCLLVCTVLIQFYDPLCQTYGSTTVSGTLLPLSSSSSTWPPYSVYEVGWVSGDASSLITEPEGLSFLSIVAFGYIMERAEDCHHWAFSFTNTHVTRQSPLAGIEHSRASISSLYTKSLKDDMTSDFLPYVGTFKGGGVKSGFPQGCHVSLSVGFTSHLWKGCMNRLYRCCV